jgi:hypothetical protein
MLTANPVRRPQDWKIPPCISNWKNAKGYTIPLDKRLAADGRGLQEVQINDAFAKLAESLYVAESKARESVEMRQKVRRPACAQGCLWVYSVSPRSLLRAFCEPLWKATSRKGSLVLRFSSLSGRSPAQAPAILSTVSAAVIPL